MRCEEAWLYRCPKRCKNEMLLVFRDFDEGEISVLWFCMETKQLSTATVVLGGDSRNYTYEETRRKMVVMFLKGFDEKSMVVLPGRASSQSTIHTQKLTLIFLNCPIKSNLSTTTFSNKRNSATTTCVYLLKPFLPELQKTVCRNE